MIPAHELGAHALKIGQRDGKLDGARTGDMGVGQHEPIGRQDHTRADARSVAPRAGLESDLAHVDPHDGVEETIKTSAHRGLRGRGEHQRQAEGKGEG